jgi:hypothetical protein
VCMLNVMTVGKGKSNGRKVNLNMRIKSEGMVMVSGQRDMKI